MSNEALDIRNDIHECQRILEKIKAHIVEDNIEFTDLDVISLSFNLDELRLLIDTFQREMYSRVTEEILEKLI